MGRASSARQRPLESGVPVVLVARVGLEYVKQRVIEDAEGRKALFARLMYALKDAKDPWEERALGVAKHEFEALTVLTRPRKYQP